LNEGIMHHRWVNWNPMLPPSILGYENVGDEHFNDRLTTDPHGFKEYAWAELSYEDRLIFPTWFEDDWEWVTPEEESEEPAPPAEESEGAQEDDPR